MRKQISKRFFAVFLMFLLIVSSFPQISFADEETSKDKTFEDVVSQGSYNPHEDYQYLDVRFWEDEAPDVGFYINHANLYNLTTVSEPGFGTSNGEWTVMGLLRGLYGGSYYNEELTKDYFDKYIDRVEQYVDGKNGNLDRNKSTEWSRSILALSALGYDIKDVAGYDYLEKLSESYGFSYRQGINGPIWEIIALNTGPYDLYEDADNDDINTIGKMIDYILDKEIIQQDGTDGGWALANFGTPSADPDITGMALQALAPYYNDQKLFEETDSTYSYTEFAEAVERGVYILSEIQLDNGGFAAFGNVNAESTVQVIVALTELDIDPISKVELPGIEKTANFITEGAVHDNVETNNMIDKLLTFWAPGTTKADKKFESEEDKHIYRISGGFKHVTSGDDGGGDSGTSVNGMATDQTIYGLIAYDRYVKGENSLYDMSDMVDGQYKNMLKASEQTITFESDDGENSKQGKRYGLVELSEGDDAEGKSFKEWNSKKDGSGTSYKSEEMIVVPEHDVILYAQYEHEVYSIDYELNGGSFISDDIVKEYTNGDDIVLPKDGDIVKDGYTFVGWYEDEDFSGNKLENITAGENRNLTLYAKWEETMNENEVQGKKVNELIDNLPSIENVTTDDKTQMETARTAYDELSDDAKEFVTNISKLKALEQKVAQIEEEVAYEAAKIELEETISEVLKIDSKLLTNKSAETLGKALGVSEDMLRRKVLSIDELNKVLEQLNIALAEKEEDDNKESVVVSNVIFEMERLSAYNLTDQPDEKKTSIENTISEAQKLINAEEITEEDVDTMVEKLEGQIKNLDDQEQEVNKKQLKEKIEAAESQDVTNKTDESVKAFQTALEEAKKVLENANATQSEVDEVTLTLLDALSNLEDKPIEKPVNKQTLQQVFDYASNKDISNQTEAVKKSFEKKLTSAKTLLDKNDATQEEVDEALKTLQEAITELEEDQKEEPVNKEALQKSYNDAEKIDVSNKTKASKDKFLKALNNAKSVLEDKDVTQDELDKTLQTLKQAIEQLEDNKKRVPESGDEEPVDSNEESASKVDKTKDQNSTSSENDGTEVSTSKSENIQTEENKVDENEEKLPSTATTMYTTLLIGFVLFIIGMLLYVGRKTVRNR